MSLFNTFIHGNALSEIFLEGHNPYAKQKLDTADVDAFRQKMHSSEGLQAYVVGRIVGSGRGVWAVTDQAVLSVSAGLQGAQRLLLDEVQGFETQRGRFGHTVRLKTQDRTWSLYGVDGELAGDLHRVFQARGIESQHEDRPARAHLWRQAAPAGWAKDCLRDAQLRLSPVRSAAL